MPKIGKKRLCSSAAISAGLCSQLLLPAAYAQSEASGEGADNRRDEIVVTATLREESLQDVPIAITAFQGEELERIRAVSYTDLSSYIPNFSFDALTNAGFVIPAIRGIGLTGATNSAISNNPATGVYIDGVYLNSAGANLFNVLDVERVEVLRGPQGTLYGRNTIGGVINIVSAKPTDEFSANIRATYGNYDRVEVAGAVSGPIIPDTLSARIGAFYTQRDGYVENLFENPNPLAEESDADTDSLESIALRGSVVFTPTERLEFTLAGDYANDDTTYPGFNVEDGASPDLSAFLGPAGASFTDTDGDIFAVSYNSNNEERAENWGGSLTGTWTDGDVRVVSITGYRESFYEDDLSDIDGTPINIFQQFIQVKESSVSQELRLHYDSGPIKSVFGAFFYNYDGLQDAADDILGIERDLGYPLSGGAGPGLLGGGITRRVVDINTKSYSVFGNASYDITDKLTLEAGLRWTTTDVRFDRPVSRAELGDATNPFYNGNSPFDEIPDGVLLFDLGNTFSDQTTDFSDVTPKVGLQYQPTDEVLLYASWSQGFREGGFATNPSDPTGVQSFDSETLTAYEVGAKTSLFDGVLTLNGAAYYYDYKDQQTEVASISTAGFFVDVGNAGESEAVGLELEFFAAPSEYFTLQGSFGWQDTEFTTFDAGAFGDLSGNEFPRAPEFSASLAPTLSFNVSGVAALSLRGEWSYQSSEFQDVLNDPRVSSDERNIFNAVASIDSLKSGWSASIWARNLFDEEYIVKVVDLSQFFGYRLRRYGEPRTFGVTLRYEY